MTNCADCGKKIRFNTGQTWYSKDFHPEWNGQTVCFNCFQALKSAEPLAIEANRIKNAPSYKDCKYCGFASRTSILASSEQRQNMASFGGFSTIQGTLEHKYADKWKCGKFGFNLTDRNIRAETCSSFLTTTEYEQKCLSGQMEKENANIQIILDFSSLKDAMSKGGLVMTTYKCPNCNGMVDIPEAGKVLICQYCGTPIKPVDIFEKIKSLIQ